MHIHTHTYIHSTDPVSASIASEYVKNSINIRQHKTHRKLDSQHKRVKQNQNTFTAANQSITPGHHAQ